MYRLSLTGARETIAICRVSQATAEEASCDAARLASVQTWRDAVDIPEDDRVTRIDLLAALLTDINNSLHESGVVCLPGTPALSAALDQLGAMVQGLHGALLEGEVGNGR